MLGLGDIWGLGGGSLLSRLFGKKRYEDARAISVFCFYSAILCGMVVAVILLVAKEPILRLLGANEQTLPYARSYYSWYVLGAPFTVLSLTPMNCLRTEGLAKFSMQGQVLGTLVNLVLDPVLIFGLGLGAAGAAIATVLGTVCSDLFYIRIYRRHGRWLSFSPKYFGFSLSDLVQILSIGLPASLTNLTAAFCVTLTNRFLLPYGNDKVAAMGISQRISMIALLIVVGFAFGGMPLVGYVYGSGDRQRLKSVLRFAYGFLSGLAALLSLLISLFAPFLIGLFLQDPKVLEAGVPMLRCQQSSMIFLSLVLVTTCVFQSTGKAMGALALSFSRQGLVFLAALLVLSTLFGYWGVLWAQPAADLITALLAGLLFFRILKKEL